jgi:hypothetical protein
MKGDAAIITLGRREGERRREGRGDQIGGIYEICLEGLVTQSVGFGFGFESDPVYHYHLHRTLLSALRSRWVRTVAELGCPPGWSVPLAPRGRSLPCR